MSTDSSGGNKPPTTAKSILEAFRELGNTSVKTFNNELVQSIPTEAKDQILSNKEKGQKRSGGISPGENLEMNEVLSGERQEKEKYQKQLTLERKLRKEEQVLVEKRTNELRIRIKAIHEEVLKVTQETPKLEREVQIAAFQAPASSSQYELFFLEDIFNFVKNFRKNIKNARHWLAAQNRRAAHKSRWVQNVQEQGAKYMLSGEHYASRSAA